MELNIKKGDSLYKITRALKSIEGESVVIKALTDNNVLLPRINSQFLTKIGLMIGKNVQVENEKRETERKSRAKEVIQEITSIPEEEAGSIKAALKIVGFFVIGLLILVAIAAFWYVVPGGAVNITLNSDTLVKNIEITVDPKANGVDTQKRKIPGVELTVTKSERKTTPATGKTTTGEKAKGKVTILNKTDNDITFDNGTVLILDEESKLRFLLTEDVKVPKRTVTQPANNQELITSGSAEVDVQAEKFGDTYNLDIGKSFIIDDQENTKFTASNDKEKIQGGSSEEVKAVAKEDIDKISSEMEEAIKQSLEGEIKGKLVGDQELPSGAFTYAVIEQTYDKKIGDPADVLMLDETAKAEAVVYSKNHLKEVLVTVIKETIPDRYSLFETDAELEISDAIAQKTVVSETGSRTMPLQVKVKSYIIPKIDVESIKNALLGQSMSAADSYLSGISGIAAYDIVVKPQFPSPFNSMPHIASRLKIIVGHE